MLPMKLLVLEWQPGEVPTTRVQYINSVCIPLDLPCHMSLIFQHDLLRNERIQTDCSCPGIRFTYTESWIHSGIVMRNIKEKKNNLQLKICSH